MIRTRSTVVKQSGSFLVSGNAVIHDFRVERQQGNRVMGTFVVRINGEWVVAEPAAGAKALSLK